MATDTVIYQYPKCSTCRKALRWLDEQGVSYEAIDVVQQPPSRAELEKIWTQSELPIRKLFNTSGQSYRAGDFKSRLAHMSEAEALRALSEDGKLIKRPLLIHKDLVLVGFDEVSWGSSLNEAGGQ